MDKGVSGMYTEKCSVIPPVIPQGILTLATMRMNLGDIALNEMRDTEEQLACDLMYIWNLKVRRSRDKHGVLCGFRVSTARQDCYRGLWITCEFCYS